MKTELVKWTQDPPTKSGYYWARNKYSKTAEIVQVDVYHSGHMNWREFGDDNYCDLHGLSEWTSDQWVRTIEPIPNPVTTITKEQLTELYLNGDLEHDIEIKLTGKEGNRLDFVIKATAKGDDQ